MNRRRFVTALAGLPIVGMGAGAFLGDSGSRVTIGVDVQKSSVHWAAVERDGLKVSTIKRGVMHVLPPGWMAVQIPLVVGHDPRQIDGPTC